MTSRSMLLIHKDLFQLSRKDKLLFTRIKVIVLLHCNCVVSKWRNPLHVSKYLEMTGSLAIKHL
jgi:hypothetical protein